jgi:hypothetical protein
MSVVLLRVAYLSVTNAFAMLRLHLEDVRAMLPFGNAITVHGPAEARAHLRALAADLARHYASSPTS